MEKASIDPTTGFPVKPEDQKMWYTTFCNASEVDRIMKPQNGDDLILQRRADIIADHVRFTRLYCKKAHQPNWSLEQSFSKEHYKNFLKYLKDKKFQTEIFNIDQKQELEADLKSLTIPVYPSEVYKRQYVAAICWFVFLEIAEFASENINPSIRSYQTHPTANDRIVNIRDNAPQPENFSEMDKELIERLINLIAPLKDFLQDNISTNTEWRGRELIDRVDY